MTKKPPETIDEIVEYFASPLEVPEIDKSLYYTPKPSKTDLLIDSILRKKSTNRGSEVLSPITLLDSTAIIPPEEDFQKLVYYTKAITYGDYVELYISDKPVIKHKNPRKIYAKARNRDNSNRSSEYRRRNSIDALNKIRRLTLANFMHENTKLMTLTFGDCNFDINDPKICNPLFSDFMGKLRKRYSDFMYLGVFEFQKRGACHYHILNNLPYIQNEEELAPLWSHGFTDIRRPDYIVPSYLFKYLAKDLNDEKLKGVRVYFQSRNLLQPKEYVGIQAYNLAEKVAERIPIFANEYKNHYNGSTVKYRQFDISSAHKKNDER